MELWKVALTSGVKACAGKALTCDSGSFTIKSKQLSSNFEIELSVENPMNMEKLGGT